MSKQPERKTLTENLEHASIRQYCKAVRTPAIGANFVSLAEQAVKENQTHIAKLNNQVRRAMAKWQKYELIALDEVGYVPLADVGAEFLFQVISDRAEKTALIVTTNLPFSEWTTVFPNPRFCKALLDRVTDRAHIIETGTESFRFRRTMEKRKKR
jgi:DNA replication protein DnaC